MRWYWGVPWLWGVIGTDLATHALGLARSWQFAFATELLWAAIVGLVWLHSHAGAIR